MASLLRRIVGFAWSNKTMLGLATAMVNGGYLVKKCLSPARRLKPVAASGDMAADLLPLHRYRGEYGHIDGWFSPNAAALWDSLLTYQTRSGIGAHFMEIGVYKGKSAALLALHGTSEATAVWVDAVLRREAVDVIRAIRPENNLFIEDVSKNLADSNHLIGPERSFRWVHIDGEHSGAAVTNDLEIAERLIAPDGIICVDDFMNPRYPQITMAAFRFLEARKGALTLFLTGFNKGYACRREAANRYLTYIKNDLYHEMGRRGANVTIWKTTDPDDMNCFGITAGGGHSHWGPDWAPSKIPI